MMESYRRSPVCAYRPQNRLDDQAMRGRHGGGLIDIGSIAAA